MNESKIIGILTKKEYYLKYRPILREFSMLPETWEIIEDLGEYFKEYPSDDKVDKDKFIQWARAYKPKRTGDKRLAYEALVEVACSQEQDPGLMKRVIELNAAMEIQDVVQEIILRGASDKMDDVARLISEYQNQKSEVEEDDPFAPYDFDRMFHSLLRDGGIEWRLPELNKSVGPICAGDLIIVAKRPEVGGTTFLTSEVSHMLPQMPKGANVGVFANEEDKDRMWGRFSQSALGMTALEMASDVPGTKQKIIDFQKEYGLHIFHKPDMTTAWVESCLKREKKWDLICFNVLWKVRPYGKNLDDYQMYQRVAQWARSLAVNYHCPVIGIWQADGTADGVEYLSQAQMYGSKTGVQGEADVLIMIGKNDDLGKQHERYISIVKNKVPGNKHTDPKLRHGRFTVDLDVERGLFKGRI